MPQVGRGWRGVGARMRAAAVVDEAAWVSAKAGAETRRHPLSWGLGWLPTRPGCRAWQAPPRSDGPRVRAAPRRPAPRGAAARRAVPRAADQVGHSGHSKAPRWHSEAAHGGRAAAAGEASLYGATQLASGSAPRSGPGPFPLVLQRRPNPHPTLPPPLFRPPATRWWLPRRGTWAGWSLRRWWWTRDTA